jgi:ClpP class serine protease
MFSGLVWSGARSIELGLADALGSLDYVAREVVKAEDIVDFTPQEGPGRAACPAHRHLHGPGHGALGQGKRVH